MMSVWTLHMLFVSVLERADLAEELDAVVHLASSEKTLETLLDIVV